VQTLEIEATVREKNQVTIPKAIADRHALVPGDRLVFVDEGRDDEFVVRILPRSYGGMLEGVFGATHDERLAYLRGEREDWG